MPTIGNLIDLGFVLCVHCIVCDHHLMADLDKLAAEFGRDARYIGHLPLRCSHCNSENVWTSLYGPESPSPSVCE